MRLILTIVFSLVALPGIFAQNFQPIQMIHELAQKTESYFEGYAEKVLPNTFNYHSFRHDVGASMLTRCLETPMPMAWKTATVPLEFNDDMGGFIWIAAIDLNSSGASFDVFFNGIKRFTIEASQNQNWSISGEEGGEMTFNSLLIDRHGDAHGYMTLNAPLEWIERGKEQEIKIKGSPSGQNTWMIVYTAQDALAYLQKSVEFSGLYSLQGLQEKGMYVMDLTTAPALVGKEVQIECGSFKRSHELVWYDKTAHAQVRIPERKMGEKLVIYDSRGEILSWDFSSELSQNSIMMGTGVLKNQLVEQSDEGFHLIAQRDYMPDLVTSILGLSNGPMAKSKILLMNSSHQDIAWMDSPEKCMVERDTMLLQPLFNRAAIDPDYRFDIEDALMVKEYVERHPENKELVKRLFDEGIISCGATYIQPYEEMYSGEALARQFYFGAKWLKDEYDYQADTYWNVDVPGRTLQMPQLMAKAGVTNLVATRQELGFYEWFSPDGSSIISYSNGHYGDSFGPLGDEYYIASDYLSKYSERWSPFYNQKSITPIVPVLSDWDMSPAKDYSSLISSWNSLKELKTATGEIVPVNLPEFKEVLAPDMFTAFRESHPVVPELHGERPALWLYIHGPSHQKAQKASREGDIMLTQAEKLATINGLLAGSFKTYPTQELHDAWEAKIYPDHGWGGNQGQITDDLFKSKYEFARSSARQIIDQQMDELGSQIAVNPKKGRPILVFNSLSWSRTSPGQNRMQFEEGEAQDISVFTADGEPVPVQIQEIEQYSDGSLASATFCFIAEEIPSLGYSTYYLKAEKTKASKPMPKQGKRLENEYYIIEFGAGGLSRIYDKELEKELINPDGFTAGEVFTLRSVGNGAGEFDQVQQPDTVGFDKTGNYRTAWKLVEEGPVYTAYAYRQPIRNAVAEQKVIIYNNIKQIDFETAVKNWEGILYREYRMALPIDGEEGKVVYEVPYGKLEVGVDEMEGAAGERYGVDCKEIHPRAIQNWINVSHEDFGLTLSSSVVAFDYIDVTGTSYGTTLVQPILFASRRSCHGLGNEYLQTGDHEFNFSLFSHPAGWEQGYKKGIEANEKLLVVSDCRPFADATLPEQMSFFSLESTHVNLSVIKKAEDSNDIVIRGYEVEGITALTKLQSHFKFDKLSKTNLIEEVQHINDLQGAPMLKFGAFAIETWKLSK